MTDNTDHHGPYAGQARTDEVWRSALASQGITVDTAHVALPRDTVGVTYMGGVARGDHPAEAVAAARESLSQIVHDQLWHLDRRAAGVDDDGDRSQHAR